MSRPTNLRARLLGTPELLWRGQAIEPASRKGLALICVLAVEGGSVTRSDLAELLWGIGRVQNVRQELTNLRGLLGAQEWLDPGDPVSADIDSDVSELENAYVAGNYERVLSLYRAPLLARFEVPRAPAFHDWLEVERERLEELFRNALRKHASDLEMSGDSAGALEHLDRLIAIDPLDESAYRSAMRLSGERGELTAGLNYYSVLRRALAEQLGTEPLEETNALFERLAAARQAASEKRARRERRLAEAAQRLEGPPLLLARLVALGGGEQPLEALADAAEVTKSEITAAFETLQAGELLNGLCLAPTAKESVLDAMPEPVGRHLAGRMARALARLEQPPGEVAKWHLRAHESHLAAGHFERAASASEAAMEHGTAIAQMLRAVWATESGSERARLLLNLERLCSVAGDAPLREAALVELEDEAFLLQDDALLVEVRLRRAGQRIEAGSTEEAGELAAAAATAARRIGRSDLLARAEQAAGAAAFHAGNLDGAQEAFLRMVESGDPEYQLPALNNLGALAGIRGDHRAAIHHHERALTLARQLGRHEMTASLLNNLGASNDRAGEYGRAAESFAEAAQLYEAIGNSQGEATAWINAANVRIREGLISEAARHLKRAAALEARLEAPPVTCRLLTVRAELHSARGEFSSAQKLLKRALRVAREIGDERQGAVVAFNLAMTRRRLDPTTDQDESRGALGRLEELQLNDVLPFAYAEMGAVATDEAEVREWRAKLEPFGANPHVRALADELERRTSG